MSQLAGFAKREDLRFFLRAICDAEYVHEPKLAPTQEMLDRYKKGPGDWAEYEREFLGLMEQRKIENSLSRSLFEIPAVMLCSEATAEHCHRRLVGEYLQRHWEGVTIRHL